MKHSGIDVCKAWETFEPFYKWSMANGYMKGKILSRIDKKDGFQPNNCMWTSKLEHANNKPSSFTFEGKTMSEWARHLGIKQPTLSMRISRGWSIDAAIKTPVAKVKK